MPVRRVDGGYRWGTSGKVYKTRAEAEQQGRAAYASGYRETERKAAGGKAESRAKREGTKQGKQHVRQPDKIARKTARHRRSK